MITSRLLLGLLPLLVLCVAACNVSDTPPITLRAVVATRVLSVLTPTPTSIHRTLPTDPAVQKRLDDVQSDQLLIVLNGLVATQTRHVLSASDDPTYGIEGARALLVDAFQTIHARSPGASSPLMIWTQPVPLTLNGIAAAPENVIAVLQGTDINAGVIVVGAHYDSLNALDFNNGNAPAPGADENASGVAALVELARIMAAEPHRATIMFVAFTAEEIGRKGSTAFVSGYLQAQTPPIVPRAMFNLDTIGANAASDGTIGANTLRLFSAEPNDSPSRQLARQFQLAASAYRDTPTAIIQSSEERNGHFSDQQSFSAANIPAVRLIEGVENPSRQRSAQDTVDGIQTAYLMSVTRGTLAALYTLADGSDAPHDLTLHTDEHTDGAIPTLKWSAVAGASGYVVALRQADGLTYDQIFVTGSDPQLSAPAIAQNAIVAVATVNARGLIGPLSPEVLLAGTGS